MTVDSPNRNYHEAESSESFFAKADFGAYGWTSPRRYPALTEIITQGMPVEVFFVEDGVIKLSRLDLSGHQMMAGLRGRSWVMGAAEVLLGKQYLSTAAALTDCSLRRITARKFLGLIEKNPEFARQMLRMFSQEIFVQGNNLVNILCRPAIDRLKRLLYEIVSEMSHLRYFRKQVKLNFPLKHKELAQMIAVAPEHLSRLLKQLERDGIIKREKGLLILTDVRSLPKSCRME